MNRIESLTHLSPDDQALIEQFNSGVINEKEFRQEFIHTLSQKGYEASRIEQEEVDKLDAKFNRESLITNTSGHKPQSWFTETGKDFASGLASSCLSIGLIHPQTGIAIAHCNPFTAELIINTLLATIQRSDYPESMEIFNPDQLGFFIDDTVRRAYEEFDQLSPDPIKRMIVICTGMDFIPSHFMGTVYNPLSTSLTKYASQRDYLSGAELTTDIHLGIAGNIIYSGLGTDPHIIQ